VDTKQSKKNNVGVPIRLIAFLLKFNFPGSDNLRRALYQGVK